MRARLNMKGNRRRGFVAFEIIHRGEGNWFRGEVIWHIKNIQKVSDSVAPIWQTIVPPGFSSSTPKAKGTVVCMRDKGWGMGAYLGDSGICYVASVETKGQQCRAQGDLEHLQLSTIFCCFTTSLGFTDFRCLIDLSAPLLTHSQTVAFFLEKEKKKVISCFPINTHAF